MCLEGNLPSSKALGNKKLNSLKRRLNNRGLPQGFLKKKKKKKGQQKKGPSSVTIIQKVHCSCHSTNFDLTVLLGIIR